MKTATLSRTLKLAKGGLTSVEFIPVLTHFCFTGSQVYAYNDVSAVLVNLKTPIKGAIRGETLLGVVSTLGENVEVEFDEEKNQVVLNSGKAKVRMSALPSDTFLFKQPKVSWTAHISVTKEFMRGLSLCCGTVGINALQREFTGVTFSISEGSLIIYSSDDTRISEYKETVETAESNEVDASWIVPLSACKLFVDTWNAKKDELEDKELEAELFMSDKWFKLELDDCEVYSKTMPEQAPDFGSIINAVKPPKGSWTSIPKTFSESLRRADILTSGKDLPKLMLSCGKDKVSIVVGKDNEKGSFEETITLDEGASLPEASLYLNPSKCREACEQAGSFSAHKKCVAFKELSYTCYVSPLKISTDTSDDDDE